MADSSNPPPYPMPGRSVFSAAEEKGTGRVLKGDVFDPNATCTAPRRFTIKFFSPISGSNGT
jgi:hypothetical protein